MRGSFTTSQVNKNSLRLEPKHINKVYKILPKCYPGITIRSHQNWRLANLWKMQTFASCGCLTKLQEGDTEQWATDHLEAPAALHSIWVLCPRSNLIQMKMMASTEVLSKIKSSSCPQMLAEFSLGCKLCLPETLHPPCHKEIISLAHSLSAICPSRYCVRYLAVTKCLWWTNL